MDDLPKYPTPETSLTPEGQLGPMSPGEILSKAFTFYGAHARKLWLAVAITVIPASVLEIAIKAATVPAGSQVLNGKLYLPTGSSGGYAASSLITSVIVYLVQLISLGAITRLALESLAGETLTDLREVLGFAVDRVLGMFWVTVLVFVSVLAGLVFFIIPGIYIAIAMAVAVTVVIAEGLGGGRAIRRSLDLVRGRWWATFGRVLLAALMAAVPTVVLTVLLVPALVKAFGNSGPFLVFVVGAVISGIVAILITPFSTAFTTLIYVDLRARAEGPLEPHQLVGH